MCNQHTQREVLRILCSAIPMSKHTLSSGSEDPVSGSVKLPSFEQGGFHPHKSKQHGGLPQVRFFFEPRPWVGRLAQKLRDDDICATGLDLRGAVATAIPVCLVRLHLYRVGQVKGSMHHFIHSDILPILDISRKDARL